MTEGSEEAVRNTAQEVVFQDTERRRRQVWSVFGQLTAGITAAVGVAAVTSVVRNIGDLKAGEWLGLVGALVGAGVGVVAAFATAAYFRTGRKSDEPTAGVAQRLYLEEFGVGALRGRPSVGPASQQDVVDLMQALEDSVAEARRRKYEAGS